MDVNRRQALQPSVLKSMTPNQQLQYVRSRNKNANTNNNNAMMREMNARRKRMMNK